MSIEITALGYLFNEMIHWPDGTVEGPFLGATASYGGVCLGRLGAKAGLVSVVGKETSKQLLAPLLECGIDTEGLDFREGASEVCNILSYREDGTKEITYLKSSPVIRYKDIPERYHKSKVFHLCLVDYEVPLETVRTIHRNHPDTLITADLGGIGGAHSKKETRDRYLNENDGAAQKEYLRFIDIGKASIEDAEKAFRRSFSTPEEAAYAYYEAGVRMVVITLGGGGTYILDNYCKEYRIDAVTPYNGVVDTTGAGDTYITAFITSYLECGDIVYAARFASATSSLLIEKRGGVSLDRTPDRKAVLERLERYLRENDITV